MPGRDRVQLDATSSGHGRPATDIVAIEPDDHVGLAFAVELEVDGPGLEVRDEAQPADMSRRQRLEPYRLPDARRRRVEDPLRLFAPELLAAGDCPVGQRVVGAHDEDVVATPKAGGDVGAERRVPALVTRDLDVVHPDRGAIVDRPAMEDQALTRRRIESAPVPNSVAWCLANPRKRRLRAERDDDAAIGNRTLARAKLPLAVQVDPVRPRDRKSTRLNSSHS